MHSGCTSSFKNSTKNFERVIENLFKVSKFPNLSRILDLQLTFTFNSKWHFYSGNILEFKFWFYTVPSCFSIRCTYHSMSIYLKILYQLIISSNESKCYHKCYCVLVYQTLKIVINQFWFHLNHEFPSKIFLIISGRISQKNFIKKEPILLQFRPTCSMTYKYVS